MTEIKYGTKVYPFVEFVPMNAFKPAHSFVKSWIFPFNVDNQKEEFTAEREANLADAIARVGSDNGLTANDIQHLFPAILRMLKSQSDWTK